MKNLWSQLIKKPIGRTATLLGVLFLGSGYVVNFSHQYTMPGPVSDATAEEQTLEGYASHAMFEQECTYCHAPIHCVTDDRCQSCHVEIAEQRAEAIGLHGLLPGTERCQTCHIEHQGRSAVISEVAFANIDHEALSGFSLIKHETDYDGLALGCESCHTEGRFGSDTVDCLTCHTENDKELMAHHEEEHGLNCLGCHDGRDQMVDFDHDSVFELTGQHQNAGCTDCHADQQFAGTTQVCIDCHQDDSDAVRMDTFGPDCARCHTTDAWTPAHLTQHTFLLDHGDEGQLECQTCHTSNYYEHTCSECHDDGEMATFHEVENSTDIANCIQCHPTGAAGEAAELGYVLPAQEK